MGRRPSLSRPAWLLILAEGAGGAAVVISRSVQALRWHPRDLGAWAILALIVSLSEQFPIHVRYRTETLNLSVTDSVWSAGLLLVNPSVLTLAVAAGAFTALVIRRRPAHKIAFNVGQFVLGITAAGAVFGVLHSHGPLDPRAWLSAVIAMAAFFVVNAGSVALMISLASRQSLRSILLPPLVPNVLHWASNTGVGVLGAIVWATDPRGVPLLVVPMVLSYYTYRAWVRALLERDRLAGLFEAGSSLFVPLEQAVDFRTLLMVVRRMVDASEVELVVVDSRGLTVYDSSGGVSTSAHSAADQSRRPEEFLLGRPGFTPQIKVIGGPEGTRGVLAVYRDTELSESELGLLAALGRPMGIMLRNRQLYAETLQQTQLADRIAVASDGIFAVSSNDRILSWNRAMERITGIPAKRAIGTVAGELLGIHVSPPERGPVGGAWLADAGDIRIMVGNGARRWIRYSRTPLRKRDQSQGMGGYLVSAEDITAEREAEQLKKDFVAAVSHELRTPLTPLKGFLLTLLRGTGDERRESRREYYRIMLKQVGRLEQLIADLLQVSAIESDRPLVQGRVIDLGALVRERIDECSEQHPGRAIRALPHDEAILVEADPSRVGQVLDNLLSNALKYSPPDAPVDVLITSTDQQAVVSVRDRGKGIEAAERHRVFDRFYRAGDEGTAATSGIGLGLYIAQHLVDSMSGRIWVTSTPGEGSTFSFSLPLADVAAAARPRLLQAHSRPRAAAAGSA